MMSHVTNTCDSLLVLTAVRGAKKKEEVLMELSDHGSHSDLNMTFTPLFTSLYFVFSASLFIHCVLLFTLFHEDNEI